MTDLNLQELKQIAQNAAACKKPWWRAAALAQALSTGDEPNDADFDHIAAFDPPTVLALLDRITDLEAEITRHLQGLADTRLEYKLGIQILSKSFGETTTAFLEEITDLEATIQRIRELHSPVEVWNECAVCTEHAEALPYPCPTIKALGDPE